MKTMKGMKFLSFMVFMVFMVERFPAKNHDLNGKGSIGLPLWRSLS